MAENVFGIIVLICAVYVLIKIFPSLVKVSIWLLGGLGILTLFLFLYLFIGLP
jgi:hypothetical protein